MGLFDFNFFKPQPKDKAFTLIWYKEMVLQSGSKTIKNYSSKFRTVVYAPTEEEAKKRLYNLVMSKISVHVYSEKEWKELKKSIPDIEDVFKEMDKVFKQMDSTFKKVDDFFQP